MIEKEVCVPEREKEVNAEMKYLDESVSNLNQTVERLDPYLSEVLRASVPSETEDKEVLKSLCALAEKIREIRLRIETMDGYIKDTLKRIEV
jgi:hypothetical protein